MRRATSLTFAFVCAVATGCRCDRSGCAATAHAVAGGAIDQGIAGAASFADDVCENGCCECPLTEAWLSTLPTESAVTDASSAEAVLSARTGLRDIFIDGRYERALDPGIYLGCIAEQLTDEPFDEGGVHARSWSACAPFVVEQDRLTTVHVRILFGPYEVVVFTPEGERAGGSFELPKK